MPLFAEAEVLQGMLQQEPIIPTVQRPTRVSEALCSLCAASMNSYVITLSAETISRKTDIWVEPPTLKHIFSEDRVAKCMRRSIVH